MENKIPQKSFDSQLHIIRDVHFDVDKYKVGELYVINNTLEGIADTDDIKTFQGNKVIGRLVKANKDSLIFEVPVYFKDPNTGGIYSFENITLSIDAIINYRIEIERLLTETEAAVYLMGAISKECAKDIIPESIEAAYKNDDAFDRFMRSEPITVKMESDSEVDTNINRLNYICCIPGTKRGMSFIKENGSFACEFFDKFKEGIKVNLRCGETEISFRTSPKNIAADENTISVRNGNGTIKIVLHKDSFYKVFNIIRFTS